LSEPDQVWAGERVVVSDLSMMQEGHSVAISVGWRPRHNTEYFKEPLPASTMVEIFKMTSPDYLIEISAIAVIPDEN
jgi:enamine deaminase RidA (YjgF/YER057c/UK114 family)